MPELRVGIVGYGLAGRYFHAPLIAGTEGLSLVAVVTGDAERRSQVTLEYPGARTLDAAEALWEMSLDVVVIATPNEAHAGLARDAIEHGCAVVVDKPLAVASAEAEAVVRCAEGAGVMLTVFQNRRWDTDMLTLERLLADGALGELTRVESRFERWRPEGDLSKWRETAPPQRGGGQLLDLGSHLVDQAIRLLGPVERVYAEIESQREGAGDDGAFLALRHAGGASSHLYASAVTPAPGPRLRVQGTKAGFVVAGLDPQEAALRDGRRPGDGAPWGVGEDWERGRLVAGERSVPVPAVPGDWPRFYALLRDALREGGPPPVDPWDAVAVLRVIEAARRSDSEAGPVVLAT